MASASRKIKLYNAGELHLYEALAGGTSKIILKAPALAADRTFVLPAVDGSAGQFLQTDGAGAWSFATVGGAPAAHAASHQHGGSDEVATATPGANAIPKAGAGGTLAAGWIAGVLASTDLTDSAGLERTANKNAASGYAGLTAGTKLNLAQMQEVMASTDLTDNAALEYVANKDAASGYAGLTAGTKLNLAQMQEVMASADLTDNAALEYVANKNAASGYAGLDGSTLLDIDQIAASPAATKFLRGDQTWQTLSPSVGAGDLSWEAARQAGTSPLECWYIAGILNCATLGAGGAVPVADILYAFPYAPGRGGTLDRIAFEVTTVGGASSVMRAGIYKATSMSNLYPDTLVVDGGEQTTAGGGVKSATISAVLPTDRLLWFVILGNGGGGAVATVRVVAATTNAPMVLGYVSTLGASTTARMGLSVASAYGALPSPFPASATLLASGSSPFGANMPVIACRYSA